jgi:general secretion pathway protein K
MKTDRKQSGWNSRRGGSALIIALWTIALLSLLVMSFALDAMLEGRISTYVRQRRRVDYLTQSGVAIAEMLLEKQQNVSAGSAADEEEDRWKEPALRIKRGQTAVVEECPDKNNPDAVVRVEIIPETARVNINALVGKEYDEMWEQIFENADIPQEYFSKLIDCWNDWVDEDSSPLTDGAEDDYYRSLEPAYKARNKKIDTVDELRLVKEFVPAILDGGVLNPDDKNKLTVKGIKELFTTYGDGKINVNAAPREVLMAIPGVDDIVAGAIIEEREGVGVGATASVRSSARGSTRGASKDGARSATSAGSSSLRSGGLSSRSASGAGSREAGATGSGAAAVADEEDFSFKSEGDFMARIPGLDTSVSRYISVKSGTFRLVIEGQAAGIKHEIQAIAEYDGKQVKYLRWREDP